MSHQANDQEEEDLMDEAHYLLYYISLSVPAPNNQPPPPYNFSLESKTHHTRLFVDYPASKIR